MQDEIDEVLHLVVLPLKSRNKLLNGECKFVLNSALLFKINKVLDIFTNETVDIILADEKRKGLQVLLNVLNNVPKLTISQRSAESFENVINLSRFKRLRHLELIRVCLHLVVGLDSLKTQLESLICNRCTKHVGIICKQKELEWPELKYFNLRYMKLDSTTSGFFMNKPWIQVLNLSCNRLNVISGLEYLDHLVYLNVSFNHIEDIPNLSKDAESRLKYLIINNNYLKSLSGIEKLTSLRRLNVDYNFLSSKLEFQYLSGLNKLQSLNFSHNPITTIEHSNIYLSASLSKEINRNEFFLNDQALTNLEYQVCGKKFGACKHQPSSNIGRPAVSNDITSVTKSEYRRPGKRISKARDVIIEEASSDVLESAPQASNISKEGSSLPKPAFTTPGDLETSQKENELMEQLSKLEEISKNSPENKAPDILNSEVPLNEGLEVPQGGNPTTENPPAENQYDSDTVTTTIRISATVHAADSSSIDLQNISVEADENLSNPEKIVDMPSEGVLTVEPLINSNSLTDPPEVIVESTIEQNGDDFNKNSSKEADFRAHLSILSDENVIISDKLAENNLEVSNVPTDESDEVYSDVEDEEFWQVQSLDRVTGQKKNIILVLLDHELKERSTETSRTITRWDLHKILACAKTKVDPVTIEMEFETMKKEKQFRTYIMEFPDAQVLLKKVYSILESRTLSSMNQKTYECIKCGSFFVRNKPCAFKSRDSQVSCSVCSSTLVIEVDEPKPPEPPPLPPISHSSSQSSIGCGSIKTEEAACTNWIEPCSAASLEQTNLQDRRASAQKYESDIEVISNPSQSSIEVLGDHSRSVTPRRKISNDEKAGGVQFPTQLTTVQEIIPPFNNLTESSSSGSLTESVVTAYEAINNNRWSIIPEGMLAEEETFPVSELEPSTDGLEEIKPATVWKKETDIYSYTDFTDVDPRIKLFLYQNLFEDDNETLLLFVKCHLWRTGGSDFDGCAVFSTSKVYFLSHSKTNFKEELCDWLSLFDSFSIKYVKEIIPILWEQGVRIQIKHFSYLLLLMDKERTASLLKHMRGFLTDIKIKNNPSNMNDLAIQQVVLTSSSLERSTDPSVMSFTICLSISILRDEVLTEILRLGCLITTAGEFHVLPGDLSWICTSVAPSIITSQDISNLIEVEKGSCFINLHFLDENEAIEEVWQLKLSSDNQVDCIVDSIRSPWEQMFSESLEVTLRS